MKPYAELLEFNQPNTYRKEGFTRIRDAFEGLDVLHRDIPIDWSGDPFTHPKNPERIVEFAGRWDYGEKNAKKLGDEGIIRRWIDMGHESMLEMADATFFIECSRVVSHELVRHRIASFQQESQRFVKYDDGQANDLFYLPLEVDGYGITIDDKTEFPLEVIQHALDAYKALRAEGIAPQLARYVLPNAMRTRLIMKTNLREWRHICKLRMDKSAQPEMQELMRQIYEQLVDIFPNVMYNALEGERAVR